MAEEKDKKKEQPKESPLGAIKDRALKLYEQYKAMNEPLVPESQAVRGKMQQINEYDSAVNPSAAPAQLPVISIPGEVRPEHVMRPLSPIPQYQGKEFQPITSHYEEIPDMFPKKSLADRATQAIMDPEVNPLGAPGVIPGVKRFVQPITSAVDMSGYSPATPAPPTQEYAAREAAPYGDTITPATTMGVKPIRSYDNGGDVDGDQIAQLHDGEKVLNPDEAAAYRASQQGAPADFGGQVFENTQGVKPQWDTEQPPVEQPVGGKMYTGPGKFPATMNLKNAPMQTPGAPPLVREIGTKGGAMQPYGGEAKAPSNTSEKVPNGRPDALPATGRKLSDLPAQAALPPEPDKSKLPPITIPRTHEELEQERQAIKDKMEKGLTSGTREGKLDYYEGRLALNELNKLHPWGTAENHPGFMGKVGHVLGEIGGTALSATSPGLAAMIPGTPMHNIREKNEAEQGIAQTTEEQLKEAQTRAAGMGKTPAQQVYNSLMRGGANGTPQLNPLTGKPYTEEEALRISQGTGKTPDEVFMAGKMHEINPKTGDYYTADQAWSELQAKRAENKPLTGWDKRVHDHILARGQEDTPANREKARMELEASDKDIAMRTALPYLEQKAVYQAELTRETNRLNNINANSTERGLKADELQQKSDAAYQANVAKIDTALSVVNTKGSQFGASVAPVMALLAVTSAEGVKRVNQTELERFLPASGSLGRWAEANADKLLAGDIPERYRPEVSQMLDNMKKEFTVQHDADTDSINQTVRYGAQYPQQPEKPAPGKTSARPKTTAEKKKPPKTEEKNKSEEKGGTKVTPFAEWKRQKQAQQTQK